MDAAREQARGRTVKVAWGTRGPAPTEQEVLDYFSHYGTIVQVKLKATAGLVLVSEAAAANAAVARAARAAPCVLGDQPARALARPLTRRRRRRRRAGAAEPERPSRPRPRAVPRGLLRRGQRPQRARAHAKLLELKMLIAQFYLDQARYFDLKRRRRSRTRAAARARART